MVALGSLTIEEPCYGTSATAVSRTSEKQPKYIRITDFDDYGIEADHEFMTVNSYSEKHLLKPKDILFARTGGTVGKTYFYDGMIGEAVFAGYCIRFRFNENKVDPKYVYWYTKTDVYQKWVKGIQRPSGQPNINKEEYKTFKIVLPEKGIQENFRNRMDNAFKERKKKLEQAEELLKIAKQNVFSEVGITFSEYAPSLFHFSRLKDMREMGINCNPHSAYLSDVFSSFRMSKYYAGNLEDFVEVNPIINKKELNSKSIVSFVPMPAVREKINSVTYQLKEFQEVRTGFTAFQKNDLLWAKITPCMQNGKSFLSSDMPTEYGFGSTEFHVLRQKSSNIYLPYLWILLSEEHVLEAAQGMFCGSAGQQRVPDIFLKKFPVVLPPFQMQRQLADEVFRVLNLSKRIREDAEQEWQASKAQFETELLGN